MSDTTEQSRRTGFQPVGLPAEDQTVPTVPPPAQSPAPSLAPVIPPEMEQPLTLSVSAQLPETAALAPAPQRRPISAKQLAANRRNALKSTGPRTLAGKARASRNAFKHGLRIAEYYPCIPEECPATFDTFRQELQNTLQPRNILQRCLFPHIVNLAWRLRRFPEAQAKIFECERARVPQTGPINAPDLIAQRCSDDPTNGFLLLNRYERSVENAFIRLLRLFREANGTEPLPLEHLPPPKAFVDERTQSHPFASTYISPSRLKNEG